MVSFSVTSLCSFVGVLLGLPNCGLYKFLFGVIITFRFLPPEPRTTEAAEVVDAGEPSAVMGEAVFRLGLGVSGRIPLG